MIYYRYDPGTTLLIEKSYEAPFDQNGCQSSIDFDLNIYKVYVIEFDKNHIILQYNTRPRETNILLQELLMRQKKAEDLQEQNAADISYLAIMAGVDLMKD